VEVVGYLLEELRDAKNFEAFKKDVATGECCGGQDVVEGSRRMHTQGWVQAVAGRQAATGRQAAKCQAVCARPERWAECRPRRTRFPSPRLTSPHLLRHACLSARPPAPCPSPLQPTFSSALSSSSRSWPTRLWRNADQQEIKLIR
jgi:hypothetical protein